MPTPYWKLALCLAGGIALLAVLFVIGYLSADYL